MSASLRSNLHRLPVQFQIVQKNMQRLFSSAVDKRGLVLGAYTPDGEESNEIKLTPFGEKFNEKTNGKLIEQLALGGPLNCGKSRVFWGLGGYPAVSVAGLGNSSTWTELDEINGAKENVRVASAIGARALLDQGITQIDVEDFECAQSAAEGAVLGVFKYQDCKSKKSPDATLNLASDSGNRDDWTKGTILANAQNWARVLMDSPANLMTPTKFAENVKVKYQKLGVKVEAHNEQWARERKMGSFLSVSQGSEEPPVFLELTYDGAPADKSKPVCLVGKGITFDSGGISIKPSKDMDLMRGDMGGAANVVSTIAALAELKVPVNVKGFVALCENLPGRRATKPGDVVYAMNGKSICVDNTDAEGRLVLADALCYAEKFNPKYIVDIATLTGAMNVAIGEPACGVFSNNTNLWNYLHAAGVETGDRVWRMPLYKHYTNQMTEFSGYDINNIGKAGGGGACKAAAFLQEFVPKNTPWIHMDMAGVMCNCSSQPYIRQSGMTGRPMRTLVEFICREAGVSK